MTLKDRDPGWSDRVHFRAKFKRYHPSLSSQLFYNRLNSAITNNWTFRSFIAGVSK